ncbi:hypothetical protein BRLA_c000790 [Brevibacillus laterosporus LMG 15441]|uniref:Uncharacterized protein n=1 Tax=Brevibacillus laterosporus LMG 15441 TaxID=1042163 RepID=A0A075QY00_BRELA|nr:hypothetical protein BRLA_c000790 [Brevibacillus laterosporus LMG 15441]
MSVQDRAIKRLSWNKKSWFNFVLIAYSSCQGKYYYHSLPPGGEYKARLIGNKYKYKILVKSEKIGNHRSKSSKNYKINLLKKARQQDYEGNWNCSSYRRPRTGCNPEGNPSHTSYS